MRLGLKLSTYSLPIFILISLFLTKLLSCGCLHISAHVGVFENATFHLTILQKLDTYSNFYD